MADSPKKKYRTNFLTQVIQNQTFPRDDTITDKSIKAYKEQLGDAYSELSTQQQQGVIIENDGSNIRTAVEDNHIWRLDSATGDHFITITQDSFAITFVKYVKFRDYMKTVSTAHGTFRDSFRGIVQINRLGLRYVNRIKPSDQDVKWNEYINPKLTAALEFGDFTKLRRSMHSIVMTEDEETAVKMNYGIYNQYFPAPIVNNEFIIDIDAFTPFAVEPDECERLLEKFNTVIAIYFEESIGEKLRERMEVIDEPEASKE